MHSDISRSHCRSPAIKNHVESSAAASLPARLRKSLPCSVTATKRAHLERLWKEAASKWNGSRRGRTLSAIDPSLPGRSFLKRAAGLTRRQLGVLIQLRTGHAPLLKHLHRIQCSPVPDCPACGEEHETVHHYLLTCPRFARARYKHIVPLGSAAATSPTCYAIPTQPTIFSLLSTRRAVCEGLLGRLPPRQTEWADTLLSFPSSLLTLRHADITTQIQTQTQTD